jgi:pSer/pThr/pTyr-binding forkhead associated (FHA) protein
VPEKSRRARLFSKVGETRGARFEIAGEATIGRNPENAVVLEPSLVSSRHARISYDSEQDSFVLEDLGSLNGTALDGHVVTGRERLGHLHVITFAGKHEFIFQDLERCAGRHRTSAPSAAAAPSEPAPARKPAAKAPPKEVTGVEKAVAVMPSFLAGEPGEAPELPHEREVTGVEKAVAVMPSFLATRDQPADAGASDPSGPSDLSDSSVTRLEKRVFTIPEVLARRDDDSASQPVETLELEDVDLPSASELLAEEEPTESVLELMAGAAGKVVYCLEFAAAAGGFQSVELVEGDNVIGRGGDARIKPDSLDISRRHAVVTVTGDSVTVRDLGSRNRTFVDDEEVDGQVEVRVGARLRFGGVEARLTAIEKS